MRSRDHFVVVVSLDFRVDVMSPDGVTEVPLELDRLESVCTPLTLDDCWLLVETELLDGIGTTGVVVVCIVDELEDEVCARAAPVINVIAPVTNVTAPVINVTASVAASRVFIMSCPPEGIGAGRSARFSRAEGGTCGELAAGSEITQSTLASI